MHQYKAFNSSDNLRTNETTKTMKQKLEEKQLYRYFKLETSNIAVKKTWIWPRKGNIKGENKSLENAAQNNAIRTTYIKAQWNSKFTLCGEKDETIS